ncbi:tetratricopeptide repeat protein [Methylomonas rosea]|uniref:Tetratricopeptide repeat protein n=1 Tax=Methylomonas rosea TaxID=2952227 RepID=A0ABT1TTT6_9GAMM|nr:hypothetical protein [Methylomonas sp. WSC-7]MCQ8118192.1 hypothetical protein [Methylomonas sp. WSC-7]
MKKIALITAVLFLTDLKAEPTSQIDAMIASSIAGNEAKVLEAKSGIESLQKPAKGNRTVARNLNDKGLAEINSGNYDTAIALLTTAFETDRSDTEIASNLGYAMVKAGKKSQAEVPFRASIMLNPNRAAAWANLSEVYADKGDLKSATAVLNIAYLLSTNKDKTKLYFQKLLTDNKENKILVSATNQAIKNEGIKPITIEKISDTDYLIKASETNTIEKTSQAKELLNINNQINNSLPSLAFDNAMSIKDARADIWIKANKLLSPAFTDETSLFLNTDKIQKLIDSNGNINYVFFYGNNDPGMAFNGPYNGATSFNGWGVRMECQSGNQNVQEFYSDDKFKYMFRKDSSTNKNVRDHDGNEKVLFQYICNGDFDSFIDNDSSTLSNMRMDISQSKFFTEIVQEESSTNQSVRSGSIRSSSIRSSSSPLQMYIQKLSNNPSPACRHMAQVLRILEGQASMNSNYASSAQFNTDISEGLRHAREFGCD